MTEFQEDIYTFLTSLNEDEDLKAYGNNALLVFAIALYLGCENVTEFAAEAITDGANDKKVDLCHIDITERRALIGQGYFAEQSGKTAAPANKASALNTAVSWLLSASVTNIPEGIRIKAQELRDAIKNDEIDRIELVYVHNCFSSSNVQEELIAAAKNMKSVLGGLGVESISVSYKEFGLGEIEELYKSRDRDILVEDTLEIPGPPLSKEDGEDWKAIVVSVSGKWIYDLYQTHQDKLFSANYRDYLGSTRRRGNINAGIKQTAASEPTNFWVYNNGITALTHKITVKNNKERQKIVIKGISIINGAQTTGALGECAPEDALAAKVLCRIVECQNPERIKKIIQYNNTQNVIRPADMRSKDPIQKRLEEEFGNFGITYLHRRSSIRSPRSSISAESIGPILCAFHGDPQTAARNRRDIFENDNTYSRVFPQNISAGHVFLVHTLAASLDKIKSEIKQKEANATATTLDMDQYKVLKYSMSKQFILYIIGCVSEQLVGGRIADCYEWKSKRQMISTDISDMRDSWEKALRALLPHLAVTANREGDIYDVVRATDLTQKVGENLKALLASLPVLESEFRDLRDVTTW